MSRIVFMVMPFSDEIADSVYIHSTRPVIQSLGFKIQRADEVFSTNVVFDDIVAAIEQSSLIIVDISGKNPNCFYELGMAHSLKRNRTVIITRDQFREVPFDVAHFRIIKYENSFAGKSAYEDSLRNTIISITSGLSGFYRDEFDTIIRIMSGGGLEFSIYTLLAISKSNVPLHVGRSIQVEGYHKDPNLIGMAVSSSDDLLAPFLNQNYVKIIDDYFTLAEKGEAFTEYATSAGYIPTRLDEEIFIEGYVPILDRSSRKKSTA